MLKSDPLELLRSANPVAIVGATEFATAIDLRERVSSAIAWRDSGSEAPASGIIRRKRPYVRAALVVVAALVAVLVVAPAFGLIRGVLPFFDAPKAPQSVQVEFFSMNTGAPAGMNPRAIADETRRIGEFSFAGRTHTLWVAPTEQGGFCFEWIGGWGGCTAPTPDPLTWNGDLEVPAGVATPTIPVPPPGGTVSAATAAAMLKARSLAVPTWISGYVNSSDAQDVVIKFSDGTTVYPDIVWVSKPISAGFFSYDVPAKYQTEANHLVAVDALTAGGAVVKEQALR
jgi:hypothetical protein